MYLIFSTSYIVTPIHYCTPVGYWIRALTIAIQVRSASLLSLNGSPKRFSEILQIELPIACAVVGVIEQRLVALPGKVHRLREVDASSMQRKR